MTLGERILKYRKKAGISQEELADRLSVTRQSISLWETDQTLPTLDNLIALADIFDISMDELCGRTVYNIADKDDKTSPADTHSQTKRSAVQTAFTVLFALSIASIVLALLTVAVVTVCSPFAKFPMLTTEYMWICFLFVPLPLVGAIAGTVHLIKTGKGKLNVIVGVAAVVLLCVCGTITPICRGKIEYNCNVNYINERTPLNLPVASNAIGSNFQTDGLTEKSPARAMFKYDTKEQIEQCTEKLAVTQKLNNLPKGFLDVYDKTAITKCDCFYIYNVSTKEENVVLPSGGHYFFIAFSTSEKTVYVKELLFKG